MRSRGARWARRFLGNFLVTAGAALLFFSGAVTVYADPWGLRAPQVHIDEGTALSALAAVQESRDAPAQANSAAIASDPPPGPSPASAAPSQPPVALFIPSIRVSTPVVGVSSSIVESDGLTLRRWDTAAYAAGYHHGSATPGAAGNTVISGHNNLLGAIFRRLDGLKQGDAIVVTAADGRAYPYRVTDSVIVQEEGAPLEARRHNASYMAPTQDYRLTLISCWPYWTNTHRVIVTAELIRLAGTGAASEALATSGAAAPVEGLEVDGSAAALVQAARAGTPGGDGLASGGAVEGPPREETLPAGARPWSPELSPSISPWQRLDRTLTRALLPLAYASAAFTGTLAATWRVLLTGGPALWLGLLSGLATLATVSVELTRRES